MTTRWIARTFRLYLLTLLFASLIAVATITVGTAYAEPLPHALAQASSQDRVSRIMESPPDIEDDFSEQTGLWGTHYDGTTASYYKAGRYHVSVNEADLIAWEAGDLSGEDFVLAVDMSHYDGPLDNQGGILFRYVDEDNFYYFAVSSDGYYLLDKLIDDEWESLIGWTESDAINTGERSTNRLGLMVEDDRITLLTNDEVLAEIEDDSFDAGAIALTAGTSDEFEVDLAFDDFELWRLPTEGEAAAQPDDEALTLEERIAELTERTPDFSEDFSDGAETWDAESSEDVVYADDDGSLQINVLPENYVTYVDRGDRYGDFLLELDAAHVDGPIAVEYGAYFRNVDGDNYYYFAISATGQYNFWKREGGEWIEIIPWTDSSALDYGEAARNRIGVLADGSTIVLLANDAILAELEDDDFASGSVGLFARTFDEGDVVVAFDNVNLWELEAGIVDVAPETEAPGVPEEVDTGGDPSAQDTPSQVDLDQLERRMEEIRAGEALLQEGFRLDEDRWSMDSTDDARFEILRRSFHITVNKPNWLAWSTYENAELSDFLVQTDVEAIRSTLDGNYGLIFRFRDNDNFYVFRISPRGTYSIMKLVDGEWTALVDWTTSELIDTEEGAVNRLSVLAEDTFIVVAINGTVVAQTQDSDLASGAVALVGGTYEDPDVEVAFDNVNIWDLAD